ncbi:DUF167 domain-containing protein [Candidatus Micrarchaeota archaeon]|nr:DUF167 domain-containing protein [Candidatus Micrarchaeota archaeon]
MEVKVTPKSKKFSFSLENNVLFIKATEEPERGKVNFEIIKELQKIIGKPVRILKGQKSRKKILEIGGNEKEIFRSLGEEKGC